MLIFIIVLCIFYQFGRQLLWYFRTLFMYNFVHRFLIVFWSKKDAQNGPKITPKSTPVRPRAASGFLASSGHLWTCHFYDFWCQNGSQNNLKMTQSSPQGCPRPSKFRTFPQKVALGVSWFQFAFSENPFDVILGASGPILANLLLVFWILSQACDFFRRLGVGRGGESIVF